MSKPIDCYFYCKSNKMRDIIIQASKNASDETSSGPQKIDLN